MRPLDSTNPEDMQFSKMLPLSAMLPLLLGGGGLALAYGAAPNVPLMHNPGWLLSMAFIFYSACLVVTPFVCKCRWQVSYFGLQTFCIGSLVVLGWVPLICLCLYSALSIPAKSAVLLVYFVSHVWWCMRFVRFYAKVWADDELRDKLYQMEADAAYYSQRGDRYLFEKRPGLAQMPSGLWFGVTIVLILGSLPFFGSIRAFAGLPYSHVALAVVGLPISMMGAGLSVRGWLVCFYYPRKIRQQTGKPTFVDLTAPLPGRAQVIS